MATSLRDVTWAMTQARARVEKVWHLYIAGAVFDWDPRIPLGSASLSSAEIRSETTRLWTQSWLKFRDELGANLSTRSRKLTDCKLVDVPDFLIVDTVDEAARLAGNTTQHRISAGFDRSSHFREAFPERTADPILLAALIKGTDGWADLDITILIEAARRFAGPEYIPGLTPRQIAMPGIGMQAKWLNVKGRRNLVEMLSGRSPLGLAEPHPKTVEFTYLDPVYLTSGRRRHDWYALGDNWELPYPPSVVLICENKDTAIAFPPVPGGIVVQGNGKGTDSIAGLPWLRPADGSRPHVIYWGDIDADGLEILAAFRRAKIAADSVLMDMPTYNRFHKLGTNVDVKGKPVGHRPPRDPVMAELNDAEKALYKHLCSEGLQTFRRIEQEHLPLDFAHRAVLQVIDSFERE